MWNSKKSETPSRPVGTPQTAPEGSTAATGTAPSGAYRTAEPETRRGGTIGKAVKIIGDIHSNEDLYIDGEVQGTLDVANSRLTIGPNGKAKSNVRAREVIIQGQVQGNVEASQKITIRKEGSLVGDIKTTGIIIEDDAYFKGSIDIVRKEQEAAAAR
jgi:cytoskeletal protein CcmA (bactofilin family)